MRCHAASSEPRTVETRRELRAWIFSLTVRRVGGRIGETVIQSVSLMAPSGYLGKDEDSVIAGGVFGRVRGDLRFEMGRVRRGVVTVKGLARRREGAKGWWGDPRRRGWLARRGSGEAGCEFYVA